MSKHNRKPEENGNSKGESRINPEIEIPAWVSPPEAGAGESREKPGEKPAEQECPGTETPIEVELANWIKKSGELEAKAAELNDQYLRKAADFENFRKRMNKEKQDLVEFANQNLLLDLLPVIDDFERAIKSAETSKDFASFFEGVKMIEKQLSTMLENKWGLKRFDSEGQIFDPNRHEAIQMEKSAGVSEAVVKDDYLKGYFLKERVLRFAKVKVLMPEGVNADAPAAVSGEAPDAGELPPPGQ